jgi:hypothetical protein
MKTLKESISKKLADRDIDAKTFLKEMEIFLETMTEEHEINERTEKCVHDCYGCIAGRLLKKWRYNNLTGLG